MLRSGAIRVDKGEEQLNTGVEEAQEHLNNGVDEAQEQSMNGVHVTKKSKAADSSVFLQFLEHVVNLDFRSGPFICHLQRH